MDNSQKIFDQLLSGKKLEIDRLIAELSSEYLFMDFKCKNANDGSGPLHDDDRKNLAKALSGFANSSGGVLIWGVKKEDGKKGAYKMITNPENFVENLNRATAELVSPYVDSVLHQLLFVDESGAGVVVSFIPESDKTPHMALLPRNEDKHYYRRVGDSFKVMVHYEVADMFGRRSRPKLELALSARLSAASNPKKTYDLHIVISNTGKAITKHYGLDLEFPKDLIDCNHYVKSRPEFLDSSTIVDGKITLKYRNDHDNNNILIYPNELTKISPNNFKLGHIQFLVDINDRVTLKDKVLKYVLYSENMLPINGSIIFNDLFVEEEVS
jgi:hypothetical protein